MKQKNTFILVVDNYDKSPFEIVVNGNRLSVEDCNKDGHVGLFILAAHTAKIAEASAFGVQGNTALPDKRYQRYIDSLYNPVAKGEKLSQTHWLRDIFGSSPKDEFLESSKTGDRCCVKFIHTTVILQWSDIDRVCTGLEIDTLINLWAARKEPPAEKVISPIIHVDYGDGNDIPLDTGSATGHVGQDTKIWIEIKTNYPTSFVLFWLDSSNNLHHLYPTPDKLLGIAQDIECHDSGMGLTLNIAKNKRMTIDPPRGTETCLIVENVSEAVQKSGQLTSFIKDYVQSAPAVRRATKPTFRKHSLIERLPNRNTTDMRLSSNTPDTWETGLAQEMKGKCERIVFFHIPNK